MLTELLALRELLSFGARSYVSRALYTAREPGIKRVVRRNARFVCNDWAAHIAIIVVHFVKCNVDSGRVQCGELFNNTAAFNFNTAGT